MLHFYSWLKLQSRERRWLQLPQSVLGGKTSYNLPFFINIEIVLYLQIIFHQMKNDRYSCECNLCNCIRSLEKKSGLQQGLNP